MIHTDSPKQQTPAERCNFLMTSYWESAGGKPAQRSRLLLFCKRIFRHTSSYKIQPVKQTNKLFSIQGSSNLSDTRRAGWPPQEHREFHYTLITPAKFHRGLWHFGECAKNRKGLKTKQWNSLNKHLGSQILGAKTDALNFANARRLQSFLMLMCF